MLPAGFLDRPFAHRALHDGNATVAENSLPAIRRAIAGGYGIEIDVHASCDGVPVVFHDATLERMTDGHGPVAALTARELADLRLLGRDGPVPTLAEALAAIDGRVPVLVEMKDQTGALEGGDDSLEAAIAQVLDAYDGPAAVMSFNPAMVAAIRRHAPGIPRGLVTCAFVPSHWPALEEDRCQALRSIADFGRTGAQFISHDWTDLGSPRVAELAGQGIPVLCWTIRGPGEEAEARRTADQITFEGYLPAVDAPRPGPPPGRSRQARPSTPHVD